MSETQGASAEDAAVLDRFGGLSAVLAPDDRQLLAARAAVLARMAGKVPTPPGYKLVPVEPTEEMRRAGAASIMYPTVYMGGPPERTKQTAASAWAAMLAAAPESPR